jgi:hypothetical protein
VRPSKLHLFSRNSPKWLSAIKVFELGLLGEAKLSGSYERKDKNFQTQFRDRVPAVVCEFRHEPRKLVRGKGGATFGRQWRAQGTPNVRCRIPQTTASRHTIAKYRACHIQDTFGALNGTSAFDLPDRSENIQRLDIVDKPAAELRDQVVVKPASQPGSISIDPTFTIHVKPLIRYRLKGLGRRLQALATLRLRLRGLSAFSDRKLAV